jgi:hypothetical protein
MSRVLNSPHVSINVDNIVRLSPVILTYTKTPVLQTQLQYLASKAVMYSVPRHRDAVPDLRTRGPQRANTVPDEAVDTRLCTRLR